MSVQTGLLRAGVDYAWCRRRRPDFQVRVALEDAWRSYGGGAAVVYGSWTSADGGARGHSPGMERTAGGLAELLASCRCEIGREDLRAEERAWRAAQP